MSGPQKHCFEVWLAIVNFMQRDKQPPELSTILETDFQTLSNPALCDVPGGTQ